MNTIEFFFSSKDLSSNREQLINGFSLLKEENEIEKYFETNTVTSFFDYLYRFTQANFGESNVLEICELFLENDFHLALIKLNEYYAKICGNLKLVDIQDKKFHRQTDIFSDAQSVTNFLLAYSRQFCIKYLQNGGLRPLVSFLNNDSFVNSYFKERAFQNILWNMGFLSVESDSYKNVWFELDAINILLKIAAFDKKFKRSAFSIVIRILNDNQISTLSDIPEMLALYIRIFNKAACLIEKTQVKREKMEFYDDNEQIAKQYDVFCISHDDDEENVTGPITGTMSILYKISVNDKIKYDLFVKYNLKEPLRVIIFKGSEIERQHALNLLAQLCFDPQVLDILSRDIELVKFIDDLAKDASLFAKGTSRICSQIIWSLNEGKNKEITIPQNQQSQIMISYSFEVRDLVMKIKSELESVGYKVWVNIDKLNNYGLDSMSLGIESSQIVLVCVTEKYRQSISCQAEAQYALKLKKPIIPLIMQNGYENVGGWLSTIINNKLLIDFTKDTFGESIKQLLSRITSVKPNLNIVNNTAEVLPIYTVLPNTSQIHFQSKDDLKKNIGKWSEEEVERWFKTDGNMKIFEQLKPCNGELLYQLYEMKENAPEFFYQFISLKNTLDSRSILVFSNNLKKLFNNGEI